MQENNLPNVEGPTTGPDRLPRRLAAIVYGDVAGYSRLTGHDEDGTHRRLARALDLIANTITSNGGRVVHYAGDAVLAEFPTASTALSSTLQIQDALAEAEAAEPAENRIRFRFGVNLGEVIDDRDDIYGEGVNVAARLESLANPGGVCVSEAVRMTVGERLEIAYEGLGDQSLKNIARPVRVYRVKTGDTGPQPVAELSASTEANSLASSTGLAVLRFESAGGGPDLGLLAEGLSDDLILSLSALRWTPVIARTASFRFSPRDGDHVAIAKALGVRYLVAGSVRGSGSRVRVHVELIDAVSGHVQWAERYDRDVDDLFAVQDDIAQRIVSSVEPQVHNADMLRAIGMRVENLDAYMLTQRGFHHLYRANETDAAVSEDCFRRAIELAPSYSMAYAGRSYNHYLAAQFGWLEVDRLTGLREAQDIAVRALELDPNNPRAHFCYGNPSIWLGECERGVEHLRTAVNLCPSYANALSALAYANDIMGEFVEASQAMMRSTTLRPSDPSLFRCLPALSIAHYQMEQYEHASQVAQKSVDIKPDFWLSNKMLAASLGKLGNAAEGKKALDRFLHLVPENTASALAARIPYADERFAEHVAEGLQSCGMRR
jgi:adenylate cyclase